MAEPEPVDEPVALHDHALHNLRYIREAMERASSFTSIPGWGGFWVGVTAVITAALTQPLTLAEPRTWLLYWLSDAVVAALIGASTMVRKASRANLALTSRVARRFFVSYLAPIVAGAALTLLLARAGHLHALPATWLLLYGTSFISSGAFSIRVVPVMGICFLLLGIAACFVPLPLGNVLLGIGFGGLHLVFGLIIARSYGG